MLWFCCSAILLKRAAAVAVARASVESSYKYLSDKNIIIHIVNYEMVCLRQTKKWDEVGGIGLF